MAAPKFAEGRKYERIATIPNFLTVFRVFAAPFVFIFYSQQNYKLALFLFCVAGFTDWLDGSLARKFNLQSRLGRYIDPLADKLLTFFSYLALYSEVKALFWAVFIRDILIVSGVLISKIMKIKLEINPVFVSKLHTTFLSLLPPFLFVCKILDTCKNCNVGAFLLQKQQSVVAVFYVVVLSTTLLSFFAYSKVFYKAVLASKR
ncbi:MAG: CDP-alcohol phosphatidyltransferase family protein [Holosporales bacterium]|jgi:cardiolipin synthase|nr:CDP-alcohol phosphatidyltransferase family protein [Holosporales bacterium]